MASLNAIQIVLAPQFELTITHDMGGVAAGFTIVAGISRSTGGGAGNEYLNSEKVKLAGIETAATADQTDAEIKIAYENNANSNEFSDAEQTKLAGIETAATADQTGAQIKTAYELEADTNAYTDAEKTKLAGVETAATADQSNAEIRTAVEAATDSNVFTDADHTKLNAIEAGATGDQSNAEIRTAVEAATDSNVFTDADHTKLNAIEASATADQTDAEIRTAVEAATDSNVFTDADHTKLNAIEASATADQSDSEIETAYNTQVAKVSAPEIAAGTEASVRRYSPVDVVALIDAHAPAGTDASHYAAPLDTTVTLKALTEASLTDKQRRYVEAEITDYFYDAEAVTGDLAPDDQTGGTGFWLKVVASGETAASIKTKYESNADTNEFSDAEQTKLAGIETAATADQTDAEIRTAVEAATDSNVFTDADHTKLNAIEASATADQSDAEIRTAVEAATDSNVFTDADHTKLNAIEALAEVNHVVAVSEHVVDYTLALTDAGDIQEMNKATAIVLTIPTNATVAFPIGTIISISSTGVGITTITAAATVTLNGVSAGSGAMDAQWAGVSLYKRATDTWVVQGAIGTVA